MIGGTKGVAISAIDGTAFALAALRDIEPAVAAKVAAFATTPKALRTAIAAALSGDAQHEDLIVEVLRRTAVAWSPDTYRVLPVLRPYVARDGAARGPASADQWGMPDSRGLFRDDNSMLKALPASLRIVDGNSRPAARRGRGWTACHAWRALPSCAKASSDPWLNSFLPVVTWVPTVLAPYTDVEESRAQAVLKGIGESYRRLPLRPEVAEVAAISWEKLPPCAAVEPLLRFEHSPAFVARRVTSLRRVGDGLATVARGEPLPRKILTQRYTNGLPSVEPTVLQELAMRLTAYASRVEVATADG